ncbi:c-type cytochrome [Heliobacterium chlorum]|uniref:C-type cytochrome n=2 Tax=Heliobacterium chlorum TaxID=2698 RepID=A0ABR7SYJ8_HELCL|nr:c-type cytochrome [Heliobacterium chlorum]
MHKEERVSTTAFPDHDYMQRFEPLGPIPVPPDNPMTEAKIQLGKTLFYDSRLSGDNQLSCLSCHSPELGFSDNLTTFVGFNKGIGRRNSQTIINAGYYQENFWDGRAKSLEEQALGPIQSPAEMNQNIDELVRELKAVPWYVDQFQKVFGEEVTASNIAKAIAAFERTIVVNNSDFDRYIAGDDNALTPQAKKGMELFINKAGCYSCHHGPNLTDNNYYNVGTKSEDLGRYNVTHNEADRGKFRTPGLRGLNFTGPYLHNGSEVTLEDVVHLYNVGGNAHPNKDPRIKPLGLTEDEELALVAFLSSMSGTPPKVSQPTIP